jgi:hypothetical protein
MVSNDPFEIKNMNVTFSIIVLESNTVCPIAIETIHGYQGIDIRKGWLCVVHTMKDPAPNTESEIVNVRGKEIRTVLILCESMAVHQGTHQHSTQILKQ